MQVFFKDRLGTKKRWPMAVILGAYTDWPRVQKIDKWQQLGKVGMDPFEPQDVSGWSLSNVWTDGRLKHLNDLLYGAFRDSATANGCGQMDAPFRLTECHFNSRAEFLKSAAAFALPGPENVGKYSFGVAVFCSCRSLHVPFVAISPLS